ncbi:MAG: N-acetylmuramoyl-L-alanine amidase [Polaromonas sp.]
MLANTPLPTPLAREVGKPSRPVELIVIHCAATPSGKPIGQGLPGTPGYLNAPKVINAWHAARGFKRQAEAVRALSSQLPSIGYHYVIDLTGEVWSGRGLGEVGAHAQNFNARSVGICLVGGAERDAKYTTAQWRSLQQVVSMLGTTFTLPLAPARRVRDKTNPLGYTMLGGVCGHRDLSPDGDGDGLVEPFEWTKTCPGFDVAAWLARGMEPLPAQVCEAKP